MVLQTLVKLLLKTLMQALIKLNFSSRVKQKNLNLIRLASKVVPQKGSECLKID